MNRRNFIKSTAIIAAPAFVSSTGLFRGACDIWVPDETLVIDLSEKAKIVRMLLADIDFIKTGQFHSQGEMNAYVKSRLAEYQKMGVYNSQNLIRFERA